MSCITVIPDIFSIFKALLAKQANDWAALFILVFHFFPLIFIFTFTSYKLNKRHTDNSYVLAMGYIEALKVAEHSFGARSC